jgi:threonine dehydrogenase-like Zn-dependent dehydrogenase
VLCRSLACGICGSDLHAARHFDEMVDLVRGFGPAGEALDPSRDMVMGHEYCAEVVEGGSGGLAPGTRVVSIPTTVEPDGIRAVGYSHHRPGGFGELLVLNEMLCLPVPGDLPTELAALTEPLAVGRHAVEKAQLEDDSLPLVVGCGPIGLAVILALKQRGIGPVVAADFSAGRRALAERLGADEVLDPAEGSPYERWEDLAWPEGVDRTNPFVALIGPEPRPGVIFECVGIPGMIAATIDGAMRRSQVVVVGVCMQEDRLQPMAAISKEVSLQFVLGYTPEEFADTLRALADGEIDAEPLITGRVGLDGVAGAFTDLADPERHAKVLVQP